MPGVDKFLNGFEVCSCINFTVSTSALFQPFSHPSDRESCGETCGSCQRQGCLSPPWNRSHSAIRSHRIWWILALLTPRRLATSTVLSPEARSSATSRRVPSSVESHSRKSASRTAWPAGDASWLRASSISGAVGSESDSGIEAMLYPCRKRERADITSRIGSGLVSPRPQRHPHRGELHDLAEQLHDVPAGEGELAVLAPGDGDRLGDGLLLPLPAEAEVLGAGEPLDPREGFREFLPDASQVGALLGGGHEGMLSSHWPPRKRRRRLLDATISPCPS